MRTLLALITCLSLALTTRGEGTGGFASFKALPEGVIYLAAGAGTNFTAGTMPVVPLSSATGQGNSTLLICGFTNAPAGATVTASWTPTDGTVYQSSTLVLPQTFFLSVSSTNNIVFATNAPMVFNYAPFGTLRNITNGSGSGVFITNIVHNPAGR